MKKDKIVISLDKKGHKVVAINEIPFWGKKSIPWGKVEDYLKRYIGEVVKVAEAEEMIHIDNDFPDEFEGSEDAKRAGGANAEAKANSVQGISEMIHVSKKVSEVENKKAKNERKTSRGWYRYLTRLALPVLLGETSISHYNVYLATLIARVDRRGTLHPCDVINMSKENSIASFA